jgi:hypothetical protein
MRVDEAFPSKYLSASDLQGRPAVVRIDMIQMEKMDDGNKPVLYFVGKKKGFVCNKTNATKIADVLRDDEMDRWPGQTLELYEAEVDFQGRSVPAIRVRAPRTETRSPERPVSPPREQQQYREPAHDNGRGDPGVTRAYDREVDDRPQPPPARPATNRDLDDDIPF